jgi:spermidine synthase
MQPGEVELTTKRVGHYFTDTWFYGAAIPTYIGGIMTFAWGAKNPTARDVTLETLNARFEKANIKTRYYTPAVHKGAFALPRYLEELVIAAKA